MKKLVNVCIATLLVIVSLSTSVFAASYDNIDRKFSGYGTSTSKKEDQNIGKEFTVGQLVNKGNKAVTVTDTFTAKKEITFSKQCDTSISASIGVTDGAVSGGLGTSMNKSYKFSSKLCYSYTKKITKKVPKKTTYTVKVQAKGDSLKVYYKHFIAWVTVSKGQGTVYIPRYYSFITY
ncbi:MAG: hypothetical protein UCH84_03855 [Eubacterium sp.]|nr:hypothetical protein [Eubacterium sp.]